jgi:hypothetical protein
VNRIKNSLVACAGLALVIALVALATPTSTQGQDGDTVGPPKPVKVVNTPAEPVPVTGTTTITGDVTLAPGTSVAINNSPTVHVGNAPDAPVPGRDVDNPARQPFQRSMSFPASFTVPSGKRLVIEVFSARVSFPEPCRLSDLYLVTVTGGQTAFYYHSPTTIEPVLLPRAVVVNQQTRIYADPGTSVTVNAERACFLGGTFDDYIGTATISGYLVDVP